MKISLPKNYTYEDVAEVKEGILYIHKLGKFEDLMYDLTYAIKDSSKCYYCSKPLSRDKSTLDHMFPRDLGGPTLPDNLCISCTNCNNAKSNMTEEQFLLCMSLLESQKEEFVRDIGLQNHIFKKWYSPVLPKEWISQEPVEKIIVYFFIGQGINGKSYKKVEKNYKKFGRIVRPIIVDRNFKLLDGFNVLLFAKNNSILVLPTIILDNVELV